MLPLVKDIAHQTVLPNNPDPPHHHVGALSRLPSELQQRILDNVPVQYIKSLLYASKLSAQLLMREEYWKRQCIQYQYDLTTTIYTTCPRRIPYVASWKHSFRDQYLCTRNWSKGSFQRSSLPSHGNICYLLDGKQNKAFGASLQNKLSAWWDVQTGHTLFRIEPDQQICAAIYSEHLNYLAYGQSDGIVQFVDFRCPSSHRDTIKTLPAHSGRICSMQHSAHHLLTGSDDGRCRLWDLRNFAPNNMQCCLQEIHLTSPLTAVAINSNNQTIIAASTDRDVKCFNLHIKTSQDVKLASTINCILTDNHNTFLATDDGTILSFDQEGLGSSKTILPSLGIPISALSKHGDRLIFGCTNGLLGYKNLHEEHHHLILEHKRGIIWQIFADQSRLLSSSLDHKLLLHYFGPTKYYSD